MEEPRVRLADISIPPDAQPYVYPKRPFALPKATLTPQQPLGSEGPSPDAIELPERVVSGHVASRCAAEGGSTTPPGGWTGKPEDELPPAEAAAAAKLLDPGGREDDEGRFMWVAVAGCAGFRRVWKEAFCDDGTRCYYKELPPSL